MLSGSPMLPRMLVRSSEIPAALAQLCSEATSPTAFCALLTWAQNPSTALWPWLAATPPKPAVIAAAAVHPAPAVSAQADAQAADPIEEAVFSIAFQRSSTLHPSAFAGRDMRIMIATDAIIPAATRLKALKFGVKGPTPP
jgi:hypothetical protein